VSKGLSLANDRGIIPVSSSPGASHPQFTSETAMPGKPYYWGGFSLLSLFVLTAVSDADVVVRGPFGRTWSR